MPPRERLNVDQRVAGAHDQGDNPTQALPLARQDDVVVSKVEDDLLVYDRRRHRAHALNRSAALVWQHCDGQRTVGDLASLLRRELEPSADESVVWLALTQLGRAHLLHSPVTAPGAVASYSRRELLRRAGVSLVAGAFLLPVVESIVAPTAAAAATPCIAKGDPCGTDKDNKKYARCCHGLKCIAKGKNSRRYCR